MRKRSNFTPMNRFHEIIDHYGLKLMEVGVNHLRIFSEGRKLFDYYPLRMKLFDYRQWQQLTYPSLLDGTDNGKRNLTASSKDCWYHRNKLESMKENNNTPLVWNNIPEWAIFALEYGIEEELFLTDEDKDLITRFIGENFPNGYTMSVDWEAYREFDAYPAFGKPCKTYEVTFITA